MAQKFKKMIRSRVSMEDSPLPGQLPDLSNNYLSPSSVRTRLLPAIDAILRESLSNGVISAAGDSALYVGYRTAGVIYPQEGLSKVNIRLTLVKLASSFDVPYINLKSSNWPG